MRKANEIVEFNLTSAETIYYNPPHPQPRKHRCHKAQVLIGYHSRELRIRAVSKPGNTMDYQLMTVGAFMQSYDRDVLALQDDPKEYINHEEVTLEIGYPMGFAFDKQGNKVWPLSVLREHFSIYGEPQWPEVSLRP